MCVVWHDSQETLRKLEASNTKDQGKWRELNSQLKEQRLLIRLSYHLTTPPLRWQERTKAGLPYRPKKADYDITQTSFLPDCIRTHSLVATKTNLPEIIIWIHMPKSKNQIYQCLPAGQTSNTKRSQAGQKVNTQNEANRHILTLIWRIGAPLVKKGHCQRTFLSNQESECATEKLEGHNYNDTYQTTNSVLLYKQQWLE